MSSKKRGRPSVGDGAKEVKRQTALSFVSCPVCLVRFPDSFLSAHVNSCLDSSARKPVKPSAPQTPSRDASGQGKREPVAPASNGLSACKAQPTTPPPKVENCKKESEVVLVLDDSDGPTSPQRVAENNKPSAIRAMLQKLRLMNYWPNFMMAGMTDNPIEPSWDSSLLIEKLGIRTLGAQKRILAEVDRLFPGRGKAQIEAIEPPALDGPEPLKRAEPSKAGPPQGRPALQPRPGTPQNGTPVDKPKVKPSRSWRFGPRKNPRPHDKCKLVHGTTFTVDSFQAAPGKCKEFFLSHFHSDHYGGLHKDWDAGQILCSPITARLVVSQLGVDEGRIRELPLGESHEVVDTGVQSWPNDKKTGATVVLIDANHCPGAAIFLFTSWRDGKRVIHCGDCRYNPDTIGRDPFLLDFVTDLEHLHLDTTYCNKKYDFPPQSTVIDAAVGAALSEAKRGDGDTLFCVGSYTIGKERIFMAIAEALNLKVFADARKRRILMSLDLPSSFTDRLVGRKADASLHVVAMREINHSAMETALRKAPGNFTRCVGFRPTGWTWKGGGGGLKQQTLDGGLKPTGVERNVSGGGKTVVYGVAYSEHSSFEELRALVGLCGAKKVIPTVGGGRPDAIGRMLHELGVSEAHR